MRTVLFANGEFFHVYSRGVDKRAVFMCEKDFSRFIRSLIDFNETENGPLVRVHGYCLMDNHFHLLLEQLEDQGISRYMHRVDTGYTKYFNIKNDRTGCLFESRFKARHIQTTDDFAHVSRYIHLNPLDKYNPEWKSSPHRPTAALEQRVINYPWSSFALFAKSMSGEDPLVCRTKVLSLFKNPSDYQGFVFDWMHNRNPVFKTISRS